MKAKTRCDCRGTLGKKKGHWVVTEYKTKNISLSNNQVYDAKAFSENSTLRCIMCKAVWRTNSAYVEKLERY